LFYDALYIFLIYIFPNKQGKATLYTKIYKRRNNGCYLFNSCFRNSDVFQAKNTLKWAMAVVENN